MTELQEPVQLEFQLKYSTIGKKIGLSAGSGYIPLENVTCWLSMKMTDVTGLYPRASYGQCLLRKDNIWNARELAKAYKRDYIFAKPIGIWRIKR